MARALVVALRARGADVRTVVETGMQGKDDIKAVIGICTFLMHETRFSIGLFCRAVQLTYDRLNRSQLEWAAANGRAIYTFNVSDFCKLHGEYVEQGTEHAGLIVVPRQRYTVKQQIRLLLNLLKTKSAEDMRNRVWFL